jgi:hypothetical protein
MGDMNPTDYADPDPIPTEADVEELRCRGISADAANMDAWAAYRKAKAAHRYGDTARILAEAEAKERAAAIVLRSATRAALDAYFAHIKATA